MPPDYAEFALGPDARLVLDAWGLRLRRRPSAVDLEGPWPDLYAVAVTRVDGVPLVAVTFVDGLPGLAGERSPATATLFHLPACPDLPPERLVAEIERFRRALRPR